MNSRKEVLEPGGGVLSVLDHGGLPPGPPVAILSLTQCVLEAAVVTQL